MDTDTPDEIVPPPPIPGWKALPHGSHGLPEHTAVLAWFPEKDWDGDPWYYVPATDREAEKSVAMRPVVDDPYLKLEILRLLSTPGRPPSTEAAQRFYDWITGTITHTPTHPRRTHHHA